jgi:hypothetical protein
MQVVVDAEVAAGFDAIPSGPRDVEQDDVGSQGPWAGERVLTAGDRDSPRSPRIRKPRRRRATMFGSSSASSTLAVTAG